MTQDLAVRTNGDDTRPRMRGEVILAAHELWLAAETSALVHDETARSFGLSPAEFAAIRRFHSKLVFRPGGEPLILCRGVSCRLHGADDLHAALKPRLEAAGVLGSVLEVLCLSQCEHGPNLKVGNEVLCTGKRCVVIDNRPWRSVEAGPKPVGSGGPTATT